MEYAQFAGVEKKLTLIDSAPKALLQNVYTINSI